MEGTDAGAPVVKLAIWTSQYPEAYETFIKTETEHLLGKWPESQVQALKGNSGAGIHRHYWWAPGGLLFFWIAWMVKPGPMAGILRDLLGGFKGCPRPGELLKSLAVWPLACRAYHLFEKDCFPQRFTHQLAHWTNVPSTVAWMIRRLGGPPYAMVVHGENLSSTWPLLKIKLDEAVEAFSCTRFNAERLAVAGLRKPVVCPHGVDIPTAPPELKSSLESKDGKIGEQRFHGLSVGRLVATKGFHILLESLATLEDPWQWTFAGDGPERSNLESQVQRLDLGGRITFAGQLPHEQVLALYPRHDIFALPFLRDGRGDSDGLPNALLEAMAAGCAVIASNDAAAPEAVAHGVSGLLVVPGSVDDLAVALKSLMQDSGLRNLLGDEARKKVKKNYGGDMCIQRLVEGLESAFSE